MELAIFGALVGVVLDDVLVLFVFCLVVLLGQVSANLFDGFRSLFWQYLACIH